MNHLENTDLFVVNRGGVTYNIDADTLSEELGGASVISSDTPPSDPAPEEGDLWYNTNNGITYLYYKNPGKDEFQWVDVRPGAGEIGEITTALRSLRSAAASATTLATLKGAIATALANI